MRYVPQFVIVWYLRALILEQKLKPIISPCRIHFIIEGVTIHVGDEY